ncbi:hypothetical protein DFJ58DRAFT_764117 [Suillus subalutaceus]|uniref:uncharacterized protein n=1 Tax=Suillus subalutaceus TaxID=48586 RepID=UPI001B882B29|nr:uncharacterized protein DFJ58DRAFT_764117 [Suillus subalutaceus]KAG1870684.1 hypothetical protein DFJ58DRAFT_764117 [Suillus subalutaceus]
MRLATFNALRHLFLSCPQRIPLSIVTLRRTLPVLARRANSSTADERAIIQSAALLDSLVGSLSGLDLKTSSLSDILPPPTPPIQNSTPDASQMLIPPASDPLLYFLGSFLLNQEKRARAERIVPKRSGKNDVRPAVLPEKQHIRAIVHAVLVTSKNKSGRMVEERLTREIIAVVNGDSKANTDKELAHKQTVVNRGNALVK